MKFSLKQYNYKSRYAKTPNYTKEIIIVCIGLAFLLYELFSIINRFDSF